MESPSFPSPSSWARHAHRSLPLLNQHQLWQARVDMVAFFVWAFFNHFVVAVFFVGDILMSARLIIIGVFAVIDRFRKRTNFAGPDYAPRVAVLIPAFNEEKVIVRTVRSVLLSNYKNIRIIVIDDGSKDRTYQTVLDAYPAEIASGRLLLLTKPNGGKADALNFALANTDEEIYIGIDADGVVARDAITNLVPHFAEPHDRSCRRKMPRWAIESTSGPAGRRWSTSPARTSSAEPSTFSTLSWWSQEPSALGEPLPSKPAADITPTPSPKTQTSP